MSRYRRFAACACTCLALPMAAVAQTAYPTTAVNLRAGPDSAYPVVVRVAPGAPLTLFGCLSDWSWCDVVAGPHRGWVYAQFLAYPYRSRRVPIYTYGPSLGLPIITFSIGPYWDSYYRGRPWYANRSYWEHRPPLPPRPRPPPSGGRPPGGRPPGEGPPPGNGPPPDKGGPPPGPGPRPAVQ